MRGKRQRSAPTSAGAAALVDRLERRRRMRARLAELLPPGFPWEKTLDSMLVWHAVTQLELLRKGLSKSSPK